MRGNNRGAMFRDDGDRIVFMRFLEDALDPCACDLHAYVLMGNHVHLLATPQVSGGTSQLVQDLGRKFARVFNLRWGRTGTLFEGRFRSSIVDSEAYLFTCMAYIELNPVRAGLVAVPDDHPWSSFKLNSSGNPAAPLVAHPLYEGLGRSPSERAIAYRDMVESGIGQHDLEQVRTASRACRALGTPEFCTKLEFELGRKVIPRKKGRPRKRGQEEKST